MRHPSACRNGTKRDPAWAKTTAFLGNRLSWIPSTRDVTLPSPWTAWILPFPSLTRQEYDPKEAIASQLEGTSVGRCSLRLTAQMVPSIIVEAVWQGQHGTQRCEFTVGLTPGSRIRGQVITYKAPSCDPLPPVRPHPLKVLWCSQTVSPAGEQMFRHLRWWETF